MCNDSDDLASRIVVDWVRTESRAYAVVYDLRLGDIVWSVVDYSIFLTETLQLDGKTVESAILAVVVYLRFLHDEGLDDPHRRRFKLGAIDFGESTDIILKRFRDTEFGRVLHRRNASHDELVAKKTVNSKLIHIYHFLFWLQNQGNLCFMGPSGFAVTSTLTETDIRIRRSRASRRPFSVGRYPLVFRRTGGNGRSINRYTATEDNKKRLTEYFFQNFTEYVALRNILIMEIADTLGWRRSSINSLMCEQFAESRLESMDMRGLACIPSKQKFGYRDSFYVPPMLSIKIAAFINDTRASLLKEMDWKISSTEGRIFISARNGEPLSDKAISKIFSKAFAFIGAPRRACIKSFRTKFVNDAIGAETNARIALGLDTSSTSVAASVSMDLGHRNLESIKSYVDANQTRLASRKRSP
jgi:hypothetical protein